MASAFTGQRKDRWRSRLLVYISLTAIASQFAIRGIIGVALGIDRISGWGWTATFVYSIGVAVAALWLFYCCTTTGLQDVVPPAIAILVANAIRLIVSLCHPMDPMASMVFRMASGLLFAVLIWILWRNERPYWRFDDWCVIWISLLGGRNTDP